jgi:RND superfamily putative drug exporter
VIPILAAVFVYAVADRILGMIGFAGVELAKQSLSIMIVLLYAVVIDYSLFIFSRFREELLKTDNKYEAMRAAMRKIGIPIFYSGSTIFLSMLALFVAEFGDYKNFAPVFSVAISVVMIAALTLVPALFTLFGRKAFWPKIPRVGGKEKSTASLWLKVGHVVSRKPILSTCVMILFLLVAGSQVFLIKYEYNTMKSFPNDMPSRVGYDILEEKFSKGTLASTTVIFESEGPVGDKKLQKLKGALQEQPTVDTVRLSNKTKDDTVVQYALTFKEDPYNVKALDALEEMMRHEGEIMADAEVQGDLYFAGETAASVDNRNINFRDLIVIVFAETLLVFAMLILLTKSIKVSGIMMGTILLSFVAALGLGNLLSGYLFDVHAISNRVPVYAFVFLVALGIDYNIFLVTRFFEEKRRLAVKDAVASAVAHTGGIISSAGIILAATFAVLMTQPVEVLSTFGLIVALGILMDTFLIRGILLPGLLVLVEKNEHIRLLKKRK